MENRHDPKLPRGSSDDGANRPTEPGLPPFDGSSDPLAAARLTPIPASVTNGDGEPSAFDQAPARSSPPAAPAPGGVPEGEVEARALIALYESEAKARGTDRSAAPLFFQIGRIWEQRLKSLRNAAACYQSAYRLDPTYRPNLSAARRLFASVGNWQIVEQLIEADIRATKGSEPAGAANRDPELHALLLEKAQLLSERLGRSTEAREILLELGQSDPQDPAAPLALEALLQQAGDAPALADLYERLSDSIADTPLRVYFLTAAAVIREQQLDEAEPAADLYRRAFALDPRDPSAVSGVKAHAEREEKWGELLSALKAEAESEP
jgi:cellulose synthase operon protein C